MDDEPKLKLAEVVKFTGQTLVDIAADKVLSGAMGMNLQECVIMGWDENDELYFASTTSSGGDILWLMEKCKASLLDNGD